MWFQSRFWAEGKCFPVPCGKKCSCARGNASQLLPEDPAHLLGTEGQVLRGSCCCWLVVSATWLCFVQGHVVSHGNKMQIEPVEPCWETCKHAGTAHRSHGYHIIWLTLLISCGQTSFTGLSVQIACDKEMSVQQFACPRKAMQKPTANSQWVIVVLNRFVWHSK